MRSGPICVMLLTVLVASTNASAASSTHRCGSRLVSVDATAAHVEATCGEPSSRALIGYKEVVDEYGFYREVKVEEWVYGPTHGMLYFLRFEGNRLRRIDSRRGN